MGASTLANQLVSESLDNSLSYSVVNYLKRLKNQAKMEFDRICSEVGRHRPVLADSVKVIWRTPLRKDFVSNPSLAAKFAHLRDQLNDFAGFTLALKERDVRPQSLRNPFDIPRSAVLDQLARMRANFLQPSLNHTKLHDDDHIHSMPVSQMGNYQDYLKRIPPPLREIESTPVRQHMFGNPFKIDKRMMVDEADIDLVGGSAGHGGGRSAKRAAEASNAVAQRPSKRKPGPLSRDITLRRSPSPAPRPPSPSLFPPYLPPPASPVSPVAVESSAKTESSVSVPASPLPSSTAEEPEVAVVPEEAAPAAAATPNPSLVNGKTTEPEAETKIEVAKPTTTTTTVPVAEAVEPTTPLISEAELPPRLLNGVLEPKDYEGLFKEMSRLQGSVDVQKPIAMDIVAECLREIGQGSSSEVRSRDLKRELEERERSNKEKDRKNRERDRDTEREKEKEKLKAVEAPSTQKKPRIEPTNSANLDADDPLEDDSEENESDDEDDTAELMAELQRIKAERAAEQARKDMEQRQEEERIRTENILSGNPLLNFAAKTSKVVVIVRKDPPDKTSKTRVARKTMNVMSRTAPLNPLGS
nr:EOG090X0IT3 [Eulimnadia texana]